jgi:hypothetical protein
MQKYFLFSFLCFSLGSRNPMQTRPCFAGTLTYTTSVFSRAAATPKKGLGRCRWGRRRRRRRRRRGRRGRAHARGARQRRKCGGWLRTRSGRARAHGRGAGTRRGCARRRTCTTARPIQGAAGGAAVAVGGARIRTRFRRVGPQRPTPSLRRAWVAAPRSTSPGPRAPHATVEAAGLAVVVVEAAAAAAGGRRPGCRSRRPSRRGRVPARPATALSRLPATAPRSSHRQLRRLLGPRHRAV